MSVPLLRPGPFAGTATAASCAFLIGYLLGRYRREDKQRTQPAVVSCVSDLPRQRDEPSIASQVKQERQTGSNGRVCVVTGGSRGIGAAVCERLAADGFKVVVNYKSNKANAEQVVARICSAGGCAVAVQADVAVEQEVIHMFDHAEATFGAVTACVNNAGILGPLTGLFDAATFDELGDVMGTNLYGALHVLREAARRMSRLRGGLGGAIVNMSAGSAFTGTPLAYAMSKGALNSLTAGCVAELARHGVRVNTVSPGPVNSDMMLTFSPSDVAAMSAAIPMARPGEPDEVAAGVAWLLSEDASYVSGTNLRIAGGKPLEA